MWKKNENFSQDDISRFLATKEAMALAAMLRQMDGDTLSRAASLATQGNTSQAQELLSPLLNDPKVRELISRMEENNGGI